MNRVCVITGGNSGIGKAAAVALARAGDSVVIACRNRERGEATLEAIREAAGGGQAERLVVDMALQSSSRRAAAELTQHCPTVDVVIHNAADFDLGRTERQLTDEGIERVWATNHLGPVLLTRLLLDALMRSAQGRVITVASKGLVMYPRLEVDLADPEFGRRHYSVQKAYYQSKLAQVMYTYWLAERFAGSRLTANCIRVTNVKVDAARYPDLSRLARFAYSIKSRFSISPEAMARTYLFLATSEELDGVSGKCFDEKNRVVPTSPNSCDPKRIRELMERTEAYLARA